MAEFKIGDEVWFLIEEHGWGSEPAMINNMNIRKQTVTEISDPYICVDKVEGAFFSQDAYLSKNAVIDAMIKQLEGSRDE